MYLNLFVAGWFVKEIYLGSLSQRLGSLRASHWHLGAIWWGPHPVEQQEGLHVGSESPREKRKLLWWPTLPHKKWFIPEKLALILSRIESPMRPKTPQKVPAPLYIYPGKKFSAWILEETNHLEAKILASICREPLLCPEKLQMQVDISLCF